MSLRTYLKKCLHMGVQGWRSGESTRLPLMWPGFDSRTPRGFSPGTPVFPSLQEPTFFKFQFDLECSHTVKRISSSRHGILSYTNLQICLYIYIYIYIFIHLLS